MVSLGISIRTRPNKRIRGTRQLTWCNYGTALIDGGRGGLVQSALPLVDDLVDTASDI